MLLMSSRRALLLVLALGAPRCLVAQADLGVHLFGVSYHYQSRTYQDAAGVRRRYRQLNPGLGAEYVLRSNERMVITAEGGVYRDSKDRTNVFAGPALRLRAGSHLLLGGGLVLMTSRTYGIPVAPLPLATAHWSHVGLNATWIPALDRRDSGAAGLFLAIYL